MDINEYGICHRPGNPLDYPDEVATVDKILSGDYFPKDILDKPACYFTDYKNDSETKKMLRDLKLSQKNPNKKLTIYRGAPSNGELNTGDWVTLSRTYAEKYAGNGEYSDSKDSKVYSYEVEAKDLSFDGDSIYEYGYWGTKII